MTRLLALVLLLAAAPARAAGTNDAVDAAIRGQQLGVLLLAGGAAMLVGGVGVVDATAPVPGADYSHPDEHRPVTGPAVGGSMVGLGALAAATGAVSLGVYGLDGARALRDAGRRHPFLPGRASIALLVAAPVGYLAAAPVAAEEDRRRVALGMAGAGVALGAVQLGANVLGRRSYERLARSSTVRVVPAGTGLALEGSF